MSFMQKEIFHGLYFAVDTSCGTEVVPSDVIGRTCSTDVSALLDYLEGKPLDDDELVECKEGWLARMSAPGYMDCTAYGAYPSAQAADAALEEMYGEEEEC